MRLIDADKLETDTVYATHLHHAESGYHYSYSEGVINEAPTVQAIPIEWIKEWSEAFYEGMNPKGWKRVTDYMLEDWEEWKKKETID